MLLYSFVPVLAVDTTELGVDEDIVGFGDFDEFLVRGLVVGIFVWVVFFREGAVGFFDLAVVCVFFEAEELDQLLEREELPGKMMILYSSLPRKLPPAEVGTGRGGRERKASSLS